MYFREDGNDTCTKIESSDEGVWANSGCSSRKARVSQAAIQKITSGKSQSTTKLLEISRALQIRPEWLGEGVLPIKEPTLPTSQQPNISPEHEWGNLVPWDSMCPIPEDEVEVPYLRDIELVAGDSSFANKNIMVSNSDFLNLFYAEPVLWKKISFAFQPMETAWSRSYQMARR